MNSEDLIKNTATIKKPMAKAPIHEAIRDTSRKACRSKPLVDVFTIEERQRAYLRLFQVKTRC